MKNAMKNSMNRRSFLRQSLIGIGAGASMFSQSEAQAQANGYKALVCVMLYGGNDGLNTIAPADDTGYGKYAAVRGAVALPRSSIVQLNANYGLHPNLAALKPVFDAGDLALTFNVGPLARPMTQAEYFAWRDSGDDAKVPASLFSHSDQQILWQNSLSSTTVRTGWGGRLCDALNGESIVSISGNSTFGAGLRGRELNLPTPGGSLSLNGIGTDTQSLARRAALNSLAASSSASVLQSQFAALQRATFARGDVLSPILKQAPSNGSADAANPEISAAFGNLAGDQNNTLSKQLYQVAKLIKNRATLGAGKHVFFVSLGGFDTHDAQIAKHAPLMTAVGQSLAGFYKAMKDLGLQDDVTLFTQSDFGRTFKSNSSGGTDHAWGNEHFVMGGAVSGGKSWGQYPSLVLGGPDDAGKNTWEQQGRWIPSISVDQYAATMIKWFAPELSAQMPTILPNLANFPVKDIGFMG